MTKLRVPLGTPEDQPHTVVMVSADFETNKDKLAILVIVSIYWLIQIPYEEELGMWACRVMDEETVHVKSQLGHPSNMPGWFTRGCHQSTLR